jgi:hypothetical protein
MPLEVHYKNHKAWDASTKKFTDPKIKSEADQIGHLLMTIGISEVSDKTINEIIVRKMILDRLYNDFGKNAKQYKEIFEKHLGLFIAGRWANTETRWKFFSRHAKSMVRDIEHKVVNG